MHKSEIRFLFGEGPTEKLFLELFKQYYSRETSKIELRVEKGNGGSSGSIIQALIKKHLSQIAPDAPSLVLLDEDKGLDKEAKSLLKDNKNIQVVFSQPQVVEGLFLELLDDQLAACDQTPEKLKKYFNKQHLKEEKKTLKALQRKRLSLFPVDVINSKRKSISAIGEIFTFLDLS